MSGHVIDQRGLDTELARTLHRLERVDLKVLRGSLEEVRRQRPELGPTLARVLVARGVLSEAELASLLGELGPPSLHDSGEVELLRRWATASSEAQSAETAARPRRSDEDSSAHGWTVGPADDGATQRVHVASSSASLPALRASAEVEGWRVGAKIGDYLLESRAGAGGMGVVFAARCVRSGERRAIKTLRANSDAETIARFRREGEAQAKVAGHENVTRVYEMSEAHGRPFIVMDLVEGGDFDKRIRRATPPFEETTRIVAGVARGLEHMHARGVLHRDVKPSNVLFDARGVPKLVDFGLARFDGASTLTATGEVMGTPSYMAPEQVSGRRDGLGPWTDVWGLGAVLFHSLTGRPPYQGGTGIEIVEQIEVADPPAPRDVRPDVPLHLDALCRACLQRDSKKRPTAAKVAADLEALATPGQDAGRSRSTLALMIGLAVGSTLIAVVALAFALGRASAKPSTEAQVAAATTATATATTTPVATTVVGPTTPAVADVTTSVAVAAPGNAWAVGQAKRTGMTVSLTGHYPEATGGRVDFDILQRLDVSWVVEAVDGGRAKLRGTIDRFALRSKANSGGESRWDVQFDSAHPDADPKNDPLQAAVGARLSLELDLAQGQVLSLEGAAAVQSEIYARAKPTTPAEQMPFRVTLLQDSGGFGSTLDGALHVLPPQESATLWLSRRAPPEGGFAALGPLEVRVQREPGAAELAWDGAQQGTFRGRQGLFALERHVRGRARLGADRRVAAANYEDAWSMTEQDATEAFMRVAADVDVTFE